MLIEGYIKPKSNIADSNKIKQSAQISTLSIKNKTKLIYKLNWDNKINNTNKKFQSRNSSDCLQSNNNYNNNSISNNTKHENIIFDNNQDKSFSINFQYFLNRKDSRYSRNSINSNSISYNNNNNPFLGKKIPKMNFFHVKKPSYFLNKNPNCPISLAFEPSKHAENNINTHETQKFSQMQVKENLDNLGNYNLINYNTIPRAGSSTHKKQYKSFDRVFTNKFQDKLMDSLNDKKKNLQEKKIKNLSIVSELKLKKNNQNSNNKNLHTNKTNRINLQRKSNKHIEELRKKLNYSNASSPYSYKENVDDITTRHSKKSILIKNSAGVFLTKLNSSSNTNPIDGLESKNDYSSNLQKIKDQQDKHIENFKENLEGSKSPADKALKLPKILDAKIKKNYPMSFENEKKNQNNPNEKKQNKVNKVIQSLRSKFNRKNIYYDKERLFSPYETKKVKSKINDLISNISKNFDEGKSLKKFVEGYDSNFKIYNKQKNH